MITHNKGRSKVRNDIHLLLEDSLAFFNEMERRADAVSRGAAVGDMYGLFGRAESSYRDLILHVRKAHQAMDQIAETLAEMEGAAVSNRRTREDLLVSS